MTKEESNNSAVESEDYKDMLADAIKSDEYTPNMQMDDFVDTILTFFHCEAQPTNMDFEEFIGFVRYGRGWAQFDFDPNDINWENVERSGISKDIILKLLNDIFRSGFKEKGSGAYCALGRLGFIKDWDDTCICNRF